MNNNKIYLAFRNSKTNRTFRVLAFEKATKKVSFAKEIIKIKLKNGYKLSVDSKEIESIIEEMKKEKLLKMNESHTL